MFAPWFQHYALGLQKVDCWLWHKGAEGENHGEDVQPGAMGEDHGEDVQSGAEGEDHGEDVQLHSWGQHNTWMMCLQPGCPVKRSDQPC